MSDVQKVLARHHGSLLAKANVIATILNRIQNVFELLDLHR